MSSRNIIFLFVLCLLPGAFAASRAAAADTGPPGPGFDIRLEVAIDRAPDAAQCRSAVASAWSLQPGNVFSQDAWGRAKAVAIAAVSENRYAGARVSESTATVDPSAGDASLQVVIYGGPEYRPGNAVASGLVRYPETIV